MYGVFINIKETILKLRFGRIILKVIIVKIAFGHKYLLFIAGLRFFLRFENKTRFKCD